MSEQCEHGNLRRQCQVCELIAERDEAAQDRDRLASMLHEICDMQSLNYGDGMHTHIELIGLCRTARRILSRVPAPARSEREE